MKIGYDAKRLFHNDTGLGVYSRLLLKGLKEIQPEHQYVLFDKSPKKSKYYPSFSDYPIVSRNYPMWRTRGICHDIKRTKCDLFHGLSHELPFGIDRIRTKKVVTIHDVIFKIEPDLYRPVDRFIYDLKWKHSCEVADLIIAVSKHTRDDLCKYYQVIRNKIHVIHPPVTQKANLLSKKEIQNKYGIPSSFYLSVGSLTSRKNVQGILKAMYMLPPSKRLPLVVVGSGKQELALKKLARDHKLEKSVFFVGQILSDELPTFYQLSYGLIYPSFYEGFGIPIVESLQNKKPVITSNTSSMPEAGGPGAILINPNNPEELSDSMLELCNNSGLYERLAKEGYHHALQFEPKHICKKQMQVYQKLV